MATNDPIADMLTRIRNAKDAKHKYVDVPLSKVNKAIAEVLLKKGFIISYLTSEKKYLMRVFLKYASGRQSVIQTIKRGSTPGKRRYYKHDQIPVVLGGLGIAVVSTPQGVIAGDEAKRNKVGGELLCYVS
jgi:small subunit ribosomal protein S8